VLDLGANSLNVARALANPDELTTSSHPSTSPAASSAPDAADTSEILTSRVGHLTCAETSHTLLHRDPLPESSIPIERQVLDSLETLPYELNTFDAVLSSLSIHWVNDLPSLLAQVNSILRPDAPFLAAMMGGDSLFELRTSLQLADLERRGGVSPHVSPMADVRDVGGLLTKAGFKLLTVDVDDLVVEYPNTFALMKDLQAMGEGSAILKSAAGLAGLTREVLLANESIYRQLHGEEGRDGIPATFRIIYIIGWKEGAGQGKALPRGSGQLNLKDVLGGGDFKVS
jgi:NADH dehydrogenase [ubiquinone] 1 alpha subcomplex assembly factor 5